MLDGMFGIFGLGCGLYCLYTFLLLKVKKEINTTLFLTKEDRFRKCKDTDAYSKGVGIPLLVLGMVVTVYGVVELVNAYVRSASTLLAVMLILVWPALIWFIIVVKKNNKKYFGI